MAVIIEAPSIPIASGIMLGEGVMKVREVVKRLELDGWYQARMRGSHRVFKHPEKPGIVVVPGSFSDEVATGTLKSIWKQAQLEDKL